MTIKLQAEEYVISLSFPTHMSEHGIVIQIFIAFCDFIQIRSAVGLHLSIDSFNRTQVEDELLRLYRRYT